MKNIFFASLFTLAISIVSCAQTNKDNNAASLPANAFQTAIQKPNVQILDVRSAGEFAGGRIKNALQANWNDPKEFESRTQELDKKATVYVYCQVGGRSAAAQAYLMEKGFNVVNLEGGLSSWKMNGLPVEGNSNVQQMAVSDFEKVIASNNLVIFCNNLKEYTNKLLDWVNRSKYPNNDENYKTQLERLNIKCEELYTQSQN